MRVAEAVRAVGVGGRLIADVVQADNYTVNTGWRGEVDAVRFGFVAAPRDRLSVPRLDAQSPEILNWSTGCMRAGNPFRKPERELAGAHRDLLPRVEQLARDFARVHFQPHRGRLGGESGRGENQTRNENAEKSAVESHVGVR